MPRVTGRVIVALGSIVAVGLLLAPAAGAQDGAKPGKQEAGAQADPPEPKPARMLVRLRGIADGKSRVLTRVRAVGRVRPFVPDQQVRTRFVRNGRVIKGKRVPVKRVPGTNRGTFELRSPRLTKPGKYRVRVQKPASRNQEGARARSRIFTVAYPRLRAGQRGKAVALFNRLLRRQGYYAPGGRTYNAATARAVLAFRKVNRMARTSSASAGIFKRLAAGQGAFKLRHPGAGRHVEVDRARQVMVLADRGKALHTFHVSTGKPSTPSDRGHFRFYRRDPGYNSIGMYYSVYYNGGEAIHGYRSVPTYPASNGCIRNPIPNSRVIYNWVRLGMSIYVY
jgi:hypothetical protein